MLTITIISRKGAMQQSRTERNDRPGRPSTQISTHPLRNSMKIIEEKIVGKHSQETCEDGIVVTDNFIAVIDGSTSKTSLQIMPGINNGRYCMQLISAFIQTMDANISCIEFCQQITQAIQQTYRNCGIEIGRLKDHPVERLTASAIIFSHQRQEIWMVGDCQCIANHQYVDNPKPYEKALAEERATIAQHLINQGKKIEELREKDDARQRILPSLIQSCKEQNISYPVIDGFHIPISYVKIIHLNCPEVVFASDGYPFLKPTLIESERALQQQLETDPLNIYTFQATKGWMKGNRSFDDRAYIRFLIE